MRYLLGIAAVLASLSALDSNQAGREAPRPRAVATWPTDPLGLKVAFDRPVDPSVASSLVGRSISFGDPSEEAAASRRGSLRIASARLVDDGRTLVLATDPHPWDASYVLTVPGLKRGESAEIRYDLSGVEVSWSEAGLEDESPTWSGWWPHVDPDVTRTLTAGSVEHDRGLALLSRPGRLTLRTLIALPEGRAVVRVASSGPIEEATLNFEEGRKAVEDRGVEFTTESTGEPVELALTIRTEAGKPLTLSATTRHGEDPIDRPLPADGLLVPWAPARPPAPTGPAPEPPSLAGGDPKRGEAVFLGEEAKCASCHTFRGQGGEIGPDLSNLHERDVATIYRDIAEPSATIHPDFVPYTVVLKDGRVLAGVVRAEGEDRIRVLDTSAKTTEVKRSEIDEMRPSATSIMPVGLAGALGDQKVKDLLSYLTSKPK